MKQLNETQGEWISWGSIILGLLLMFGASRYNERYEPLAWLMVSGAMLCLGIAAFTYYRFDWPKLTGGAFTGIGPYLLFLVVGILMASLLGGIWYLIR